MQDPWHSIDQDAAMTELDTNHKLEYGCWTSNRVENNHLPLGCPGRVAVAHGLN